MDTRQLAAFCAVVERRSFSQAAERLGVTQPAVTLQVRALEKRLGTQLLDRSGRRVEPTEAGLRLYRGAQRLLSLEEQLLDELAGEGEGELAGELQLGASTGPGCDRRAAAALRVPARAPERARSRSPSPTRSPSSSASRPASSSSGIVGAARRHRAVRFEPFFDDEVILACPPGHAVRRPHVTLDELRAENADRDAGGRRRPADRRGRAARVGMRLRDLDVRLELGLQESVRSAVQAGFGVTFISRSAVESELAAGTLTAARVEGLDAKREISLVRATGRTATRAAHAFVEFARERARMIVRWGLERAARRAGGARLERPFARRERRAGRRARRFRRRALVGGPVGPDRGPRRGRRRSSPSAGAARSTPRKAASAETGLPLVSVPTTYSGAEWTPIFGVR